jgi:hypothetical protein
MPIQINEFHEMTLEEFEQLPEPKPQVKEDPVWTSLLDRVENGGIVRIPVGETEVRGLRLAMGRRAAKRGFKVTLRYGDGFLAVRKSGEAAVATAPKEPPTNGRRKRRKSGEEISS